MPLTVESLFEYAMQSPSHHIYCLAIDLSASPPDIWKDARYTLLHYDKPVALPFQPIVFDRLIGTALQAPIITPGPRAADFVDSAGRHVEVGSVGIRFATFGVEVRRWVRPHFTLMFAGGRDGTKVVQVSKPDQLDSGTDLDGHEYLFMIGTGDDGQRWQLALTLVHLNWGNP